MPCAEFTKAIAWSKNSSSYEQFPVVIYFTKQLGYGEQSTEMKDTIFYASGEALAYDLPMPHLKGTLTVSKNSNQDGQMVSDPNLTFDVEIFPDGIDLFPDKPTQGGTVTYLMKLKGKPVGGMPATQLQAACVNGVLLMATDGSAVVTVGVARKASISTVVVEYKQVANFHEFRLAPDSNDSHGAGDGMFIMYKIEQIKNTGSTAKTFVFDVNKVSTVAPDKNSNETVFDGNILLLGQNVTTVTVAAGQTKIVNHCFIKQALTSNPQSLVAAQVPLSYQIDTNQPVTMTNVAPNASVAMVGNALPSTLFSLCSGN